MKKFLFMALAAVSLITLSQSCKKKVSDEELTKSAQEALTKAGMATQVTVSKGVATITGTCKDDKCKADCEATVKGIKGIESVTNNCTVTPPPASTTVNVSVDAAVQQKIKDGLKDIAGVTVAFEGNKAVFSGTTKKGNKVKISQMCASSKVPADLSKVVEQ